MASPNLAERLAELLDLPIEFVRAYPKPQKLVLYPPARIVSEAEPPARYATFKEQAVALPAEEIAPDENELYRQWRDASDQKKPELEKKLFPMLLSHAKGVIWQTMQEWDARLDDLANEIASDAMKNLSLGQFREQSKLSTYVQGIAKNKINEEMERRIKSRETFYVSGEDDLEDDINLYDPKAEAAFNRVEQRVDLESLVKELKGKDYALLQCQLQGMTMAEAAEKIGDSEDAAESRWRRVKTHLREKLEKSDGK